MKTRLIKKIFRETYEYRWIKKLKKFIKRDKKVWLKLRYLQTERNKDIKLFRLRKKIDIPF